MEIRQPAQQGSDGCRCQQVGGDRPTDVGKRDAELAGHHPEDRDDTGLQHGHRQHRHTHGRDEPGIGGAHRDIRHHFDYAV